MLQSARQQFALQRGDLGQPLYQRLGGCGNQNGEEKENAPKEDIFKNPYENPVETAAEELNEPPEEEFHEGKEFNRAQAEEEPQERKPQPQKVVDISNRRRPSPQNNSNPSVADEDEKAA